MEETNYSRYVEYLNTQGIQIEEDTATYPNGSRFKVPTSSMNHYHSTTQQDIIPLSIRANYIEDIFNLFLQELITSGTGLIGKKERKNETPLEELPQTFGALFRDVLEFNRLRGDQVYKDKLSLWFSENFNVITKKSWKDLKGYSQEAEVDERIRFFEELEINILEPSHLLFVKAYPSENAQRYGKFLFSLLAESKNGKVDTSLLEMIRGYFLQEDRLDFETSLVLNFLKKKVSLELPSFDSYQELHVQPFCPSHAGLLQEDIKALFEMEDKLQRSYFIQLLYQVLSMHLITYVVRVLKAVRYLSNETRKQLRNGTADTIEEIQRFRHANYDILNCRFSPSITLFCGPASSLKTTDLLFKSFENDMSMLQASGMDIVFLDIARFFLKEAKVMSKNSTPNMEDFLTAYNNDPEFKEYVEYSAGLMAAYYLDFMLELKNRKKSKFPHGNNHYWKVLKENFWQDITNPDVSNLDILLSLIEKHNATRKNDRETSFSWKMAYYRQFKEAGSIIQEIKRGRKSAIGYLATDEFLTLTVHLAALQNKGNITLEQYEEYLKRRGILISDNTKDSDENRVNLKKRLKDLGMFETVSDSKEAQFINTIYI